MSNYLIRRLAFICIATIVTIAVLWFPKNESDLDKTPKEYTELISFGLVSCRKGKDLRSLEETATLMKSVLISALRFNILNIDFHIFLEHTNDILYIQRNLMDFQTRNTKWNIDVFNYSVFDAVPKAYHQKMLFEPQFRCTFARNFFPSQIPSSVDSVIYMDTDTIVTGNVAELWDNLHKMRKKQFMGVVRNHKPEEPVKYKVYGCFGTPYLKPGWEEKMLKVYHEYSRRTKLEDQILLNILTKLDPGIFYEVSCRFNVRCSPCEQWFICSEAKSKGIVTVHGASGQFEKSGRFDYLYEAFQKFNINFQDIEKDIIKQVEVIPETVKQKEGLVFDRCNHPVNHLLFKAPNDIK